VAGASAEPASRPLQGLTRQPRRRGEQARLSYRLDPPQKRAHSRDTHTPPRWGPEEDTGVKGNDTTARPQAPERRPGALQGHHRGSNEARSRTRAGGRSAAAVQPSPPRGGPLAEHTPGRRSESICCVRRPTAPTDATRGGGQETEGQGQRPQPSPRLPPPPRRPGRKSQPRGPADSPRSAGGKARRGQSPEGPALSLTGNLRPPPRLRRERPTTPGGSRTPDTWHGAHRAGVASQPSPGARSGERTG